LPSLACGTKVPENAKFCSSSGQATDSDTATTLVDQDSSFEGETISLRASTPRRLPSAPTPLRNPRATGSPNPLASSDPVGGGRFTPGQILAERYRIVALAGRSGMAEVFCAEDLTVGQIVAMKFLPERLSRDARASSWCCGASDWSPWLSGLSCRTRSVTFPMTTHVSRWYAAGAIAGILTIVAVALFTLYHALAGQPLFSTKALDG